MWNVKRRVKRCDTPTLGKMYSRDSNFCAVIPWRGWNKQERCFISDFCIRIIDHSYRLWTFRTINYSYIGLFVPSMDDSYHVARLWSTNKKLEHVSLDPPKWTFGETTFRPLRGKFFTRATEWPRLASAHHNGHRSPHPSTPSPLPPKKINREHLKSGLKFSACTPITLGLLGVSLWNFSMRRAARQKW